MHLNKSSCLRLDLPSGVFSPGLPTKTLYTFCVSSTCYTFVCNFFNLGSMYYFLTPVSRVLLEKLTGFQIVKKFPTFYGTRRFITAFAIARQLSLSWASSIQSISTHPTSWRSILILSSHLLPGLPVGSFPQISPPKPCIRLSSSPFVLHSPPISFFSIVFPEKYWVRNTDDWFCYRKDII